MKSIRWIFLGVALLMMISGGIFLCRTVGISVLFASIPMDESISPNDLIAHRGLHNNHPENSMKAIQAALDAKMKSIEIDVHQTKDGVPVVIHDFTLDRTSDLSGRVRETPFAVIQAYNNRAEHPISTLDEVLSFVNGHAKLIIEIKAGNEYYQQMEHQVLELIEKHDALDWTAVHSFSDEALERLHVLQPELELHKLMVHYFPGINLMIDEGLHFTSLKQYHHVSAFSINYFLATESLIDFLKGHGKKVNVWNINDRKAAVKLEDIGVSGFITDDPNALQERQF